MRKTWALYKKELRGYFAAPLFYVVATVFLALDGLYFYSDLYYFIQFGFGMSIVDNFFQLLFIDMSRVMLITVPLLTMRLFAEERKLGTMELLFTYPLTERQIYLGKYLAAVSVFLVILLATLTLPVYLYQWVQPFSFQAMLAGYVGLVLLGFAFVACGLFVSSTTDSQVVAGVGSVGLLLMFWIMSWNEASGSEQVMTVVKGLSTYDHFANFSKGIIDSSDVAYYVFFSLFFGSLTLRSLESRRWRGRR
jgi:ABC-2 type transport system permease protein